MDTNSLIQAGSFTHPRIAIEDCSLKTVSAQSHFVMLIPIALMILDGDKKIITFSVGI